MEALTHLGAQYSLGKRSRSCKFARRTTLDRHGAPRGRRQRLFHSVQSMIRKWDASLEEGVLCVRRPRFFHRHSSRWFVSLIRYVNSDRASARSAYVTRPGRLRYTSR